MKSRSTAAVLAFFLGGLGGHKFYLGQTLLGILYLIFCWTFVPAFAAFIEFILLLLMSDQAFNLKYNPQLAVAGAAPGVSQSANIVVNVPGHGAGSSGGEDVTHKLDRLNQLRISGVLTEEEFTAQKSRLLSDG